MLARCIHSTCCNFRPFLPNGTRENELLHTRRLGVTQFPSTYIQSSMWVCVHGSFNNVPVTTNNRLNPACPTLFNYSLGLLCCLLHLPCAAFFFRLLRSFSRTIFFFSSLFHFFSSIERIPTYTKLSRLRNYSEPGQTLLSLLFALRYY